MSTANSEEKSPSSLYPCFSLVSLGCPMNQVDSEKIMATLLAEGFKMVTEDEADIIVVNTCAFIEAAARESVDTILALASLKKKGRLKGLIVTGCLAERYHGEIEKEIPEADAFVRLAGKDAIPAICLELLNISAAGPCRIDTKVVTGPVHSAYLKIAEGCNNRCTYCSIPAIRGRFKSVPVADLLREADELVSVGAKELILIAQDTTGYENLENLLENLCNIDGLHWIRLMYTHPLFISDSLIEKLASLPKVLPYLDIPVQHASDSVLKRMGRGHDFAHVKKLIYRLREKIKGIVLRTSMIVGFPGETDDDFKCLMEFVRDMRFERLGAFVYSPEESTPAFGFDKKVSLKKAEERLDALMNIQHSISADFNRSFIGTEMKVIVDYIEDDAIICRTSMDAPDVDCSVTVEKKPEMNIADGFVTAKITDAGAYDFKAVFI